jgi:hypothetical protein
MHCVWYRLTNTRCRIDTVISHDYGHIVARNFYRIKMNIQRRDCALCVVQIDKYQVSY